MACSDGTQTISSVQLYVRCSKVNREWYVFHGHVWSDVSNGRNCWRIGPMPEDNVQSCIESLRAEFAATAERALYDIGRRLDANGAL